MVVTSGITYYHQFPKRHTIQGLTVLLTVSIRWRVAAAHSCPLLPISYITIWSCLIFKHLHSHHPNLLLSVRHDSLVILQRSICPVTSSESTGGKKGWPKILDFLFIFLANGRATVFKEMKWCMQESLSLIVLENSLSLMNPYWGRWGNPYQSLALSATYEQ